MLQHFYNLIIILLAFSLSCEGQKHLVPYLGENNLYGIADIDGKIVTPCIYENIEPHEKALFFMVQKNNLWGVLDKEGKTLIEPTLKCNKYSYAFFSYRYDNDQVYPNLFEFGNCGNNSQIYFINPLHIPESINSYLNVDEVTTGRQKRCISIDYIKYGMIQVAQENGKINFLDTIGKPVLKSPIYDGEVLGSNIIGILDTAYRLALYNIDGEKLTDHIYNDLSNYNDKFIFAELIDNKKQILSLNGKVILDTQDNIIERRNQNLIITLKDSLYHLRDQNLDIIHTDEYIGSSSQGFFIVGHREKKGIIDDLGRFVVKPEYVDIKYFHSDLIMFESKNGSGFFDEFWNEKFETSYVITRKITYSSDSDDVFIINDSNNNLKGLINSDGEIIIKVEYEEIKRTESGWYQGQKNGRFYVFNTKGKIVWDGVKEVRTFKANRDVHFIREGLDKYYFTLDGKMIATDLRSDVSYQNIRDDRTVSIQKPFSSNNILIQFDNQKNGYFMHCRFNLPEDFIISGIYSDLLKKKSRSKRFVMSNGIIVRHKEENIFGVLSINGGWLIQPKEGRIELIGNNIFARLVPVSEKYIIYNAYGEIISSEEYSYVQKGPFDYIHNDCIVVGEKISDKKKHEYQKIINKARLSNDKTSLNDTLKYLLGYLNIDGSIIVEPKYIKADPYHENYATTTRLNDNGILVSECIDIQGEVVFTIKSYGLEAFRFSEDIFKTVDNDKYGLVDISGNVILSSQYDSIKIDFKAAIGLKGQTLCSINVETGKSEQLANDVLSAKIKRINVDYYLATVVANHRNVKKETHIVFSRNGGYLVGLTEIFNSTITKQGFFNFRYWHNGIVKIIPNNGNKPYYQNLESIISYKGIEGN